MDIKEGGTGEKKQEESWRETNRYITGTGYCVDHNLK